MLRVNAHHASSCLRGSSTRAWQSVRMDVRDTSVRTVVRRLQERFLLEEDDEAWVELQDDHCEWNTWTAWLRKMRDRPGECRSFCRAFNQFPHAYLVVNVDHIEVGCVARPDSDEWTCWWRCTVHILRRAHDKRTVRPTCSNRSHSLCASSPPPQLTFYRNDHVSSSFSSSSSSNSQV